MIKIPLKLVFANIDPIVIMQLCWRNVFSIASRYVSNGKLANFSSGRDSDFLNINHTAIHVLQAPGQKVDWPERGVNLASCRESWRFPYLLRFIFLLRRTGCISRDKILELFLWRDRVATGDGGTECTNKAQIPFAFSVVLQATTTTGVEIFNEGFYSIFPAPEQLTECWLHSSKRKILCIWN